VASFRGHSVATLYRP